MYNTMPRAGFEPATSTFLSCNPFLVKKSVGGKEGNFLRKFNNLFPCETALVLLRAPEWYDFRQPAKIPSFGDDETLLGLDSDKTHMRLADETPFLFREKGFRAYERGTLTRLSYLGFVDERGILLLGFGHLNLAVLRPTGAEFINAAYLIVIPPVSRLSVAWLTRPAVV